MDTGRHLSPKDLCTYFNGEITFKLWEVFNIENPDARDDKTFRKEGNVYFKNAMFEYHE